MDKSAILLIFLLTLFMSRTKAQDNSTDLTSLSTSPVTSTPTAATSFTSSAYTDILISTDAELSTTSLSPLTSSLDAETTTSSSAFQLLQETTISTTEAQISSTTTTTTTTTTPIACEPLPNPANGNVTASAMTVGSQANYTCSSGFLNVSGNLLRTCSSNGTWSGTAPTCLRDCGNLTYPSNGTVEAPITTDGSQATYTCSSDFLHVSGDLHRTCNSNGNWSGTVPKCLRDCGNLTYRPNGTVEAPITTDSSNATYTCSPGFLYVSGDLHRTCNSNGDWSGTEPKCLRDCGNLTYPPNGTVETPATTDSSQATYTCSSRFLYVSGDLHRTCNSNGNWSGTEPKCLRDCGNLTYPPNGTVETPATTDSSHATYTCSSGFLYVSGDLHRTCNSNGNWSGTEPKCLRDCGNLTYPPNGTVETPATTDSSHATYTCSSGFLYVSGDLHRTCNSNGNWSGTEPKCLRDCGNLTYTPNGTVEVPATTDGSQANYTCSSGFVHISGDLHRTCNSNGNWSGTVPKCLRERYLHDSCSTNGQCVINNTDCINLECKCTTGWFPRDSQCVGPIDVNMERMYFKLYGVHSKYVTVEWLYIPDENDDIYDTFVVKALPVYNGNDSLLTLETSNQKGFIKRNISGLSPGTWYDIVFYVKRGQVPSAKNKTVLVQTLPSSLANGSISNVTEHSMTLTWINEDPPSYTSYKFNVTPTDVKFPDSCYSVTMGECEIKQKPNISSLTLNKLTPGTLYKVQIFTLLDNLTSEFPLDLNNFTVPVLPAGISIPQANVTDNSFVVEIDNTNQGYETLTIDVVKEGQNKSVIQDAVDSTESDITVSGSLHSGSKYIVTISTSVPGHTSANNYKKEVYTRPSTPSLVEIPQESIDTENFTVNLNVTDRNFDHFVLRVCDEENTPHCPFIANISREENEIVATNLTSGTVYTVVVYTVLHNGLKSSQPKSATRSTLPTDPKEVTFSAVHEKNVTINIITSDDRYDRFNVSVCVENTTCKESNTTDKTFVIKELEAAASYKINVYAVRYGLSSRGVQSTQFFTRPATPTYGQLKDVEFHSVVIDLSQSTGTFEMLFVTYGEKNFSIKSTDEKKVHTVEYLTAGTRYTFNVSTYFQGRFSDGNKPLETYTKPAEITNLTVPATTESSLTVKWRPPKEGGVDKYEASFFCLGPNELSKITSNETVSPNSSYTIHGLSAGTVCNASITTVIGKQRGYPKKSTLTKASTEKGPSVVENTSLVDRSSRSIKINWNKPSNRNGFITKYEVNASLGGNTIESITLNCSVCKLTTEIEDLQKFVNDCSSASKCDGAVSDDSLQHEFSNLHPYRTYTFNVTAFTTEQGIPKSIPLDTKEDVPDGPPENLINTSLAAKSIWLQWDPPRIGLRNGIITIYTVQYQYLNKTCYDSSDAKYVTKEIRSDENNTQLQLTELVPFTDYNVKIKANTSIGSGAYSNGTLISTKQSVPDNIELDSINFSVWNDSAEITWDTPCRTNGIITSYTLSITNIDKNITLSPQTTTSNKTSYQRGSLKPYSNYTIRITGNTIAGGRDDAPSKEFRTGIGEPKVPTDVRVKTNSAKTLSVDWEIPNLYTGPTTYNVTAVDKIDSSKIFTVTVHGFESNNCIIASLEEYWNYTVTVTAITKKGEAKSESEIGQTDESVPLEVDTFSLFPEENVTLVRSIYVVWTPPKERNKNGKITQYVLEFTPTVQQIANNIELPETQRQYKIKGIPPGNYTISVSAKTSKGKGKVSSKFATLLPGAPLKAPETKAKPLMRKASIEVSNKKKEIAVKLPIDSWLCNSTNGDPKEWGVVVAQDNMAKDPTFNGNKDDFEKKIKDTYKTWASVKDEDSISQYIATPINWNPCSTGSGRRKRRSTNHLQTYTIGAEGDCSGRCNGELKPGRQYRVKSYVCTSIGCTETFYSEPIATEPDPTVPIAAGASSAVIVLIVVGVVVFVLRRKQMACFSKDVESTDTHRPGNDISLDKIEPTKPNAFRPGPIKLVDFPDRVEQMHRDSDLLFADAYKLLKEKSPNHPMTAAEQQCCRPKNRYTNILPFDHSRVKLRPSDDMEGSDYINANYIPGYTSRREYIATQGPMQATFDDFWRMVWEQNVDTIVMLTKLMEKGRHKCDKYWPDLSEPVFYGDLVVSLQSESNLSDYTIKIFEVKLKEERKMVRHFSYLKWPDMGCPDTPELLLEFVKNVRQYTHREKRQPTGPTIVHCSAGVGRTGTFIAVDYLLQHIRDHDDVDIYSLVLDMRNHRLNMVQTEDQYVYIHECLKAFITTDEEEEDEEDEEPVYMNTGPEENVYENTAFQKD